MKADERELRRKYPFLDDEYFDIHGPSKKREIFPGTPIFAINNVERKRFYLLQRRLAMTT